MKRMGKIELKEHLTVKKIAGLGKKSCSIAVAQTQNASSKTHDSTSQAANKEQRNCVSRCIKRVFQVKQ